MNKNILMTGSPAAAVRGHKKTHSPKLLTCLVLLILLGLWRPGEALSQQWVQPIVGSEIQVLPIFHASLEIKAEGKTLLVDPSFDAKWLSEQAFLAPDLILLTDIHGDHLDPALLTEIVKKYGTLPVVAPRAVAEQLPEALRGSVKILDNGQTLDWEGMQLLAVPMYNLPGSPGQAFHPKGRGNGYVLSVAGKRIYISGDTEAIPELGSLKGIDLAFLCMNLPYTMDVGEAAKAVQRFAPKVVIPYHYRGENGFSDTDQFKTLVINSGVDTQVLLLNFYPEL